VLANTPTSSHRKQRWVKRPRVTLGWTIHHCVTRGRPPPRTPRCRQPIAKRRSGVTRWRREPIDNESTEIETQRRPSRIGDTGSQTDDSIYPFLFLRLHCCLQDNISLQLVFVNITKDSVAGPLASSTDVTQRRASILQVLHTKRHMSVMTFVHTRQQPTLA
jgi:hypothetical protein